MKKFNSIKDFIDHEPTCMFCGSPSEISVSPFSKKNKKNIPLQKRSFYAGSVNESDNIFTKVKYISKLDKDKIIIRCIESNPLSSQKNSIQYDVLYIDTNTSEIEINKEINSSVSFIFSRLNFQIGSICSNYACKSIPNMRIYDSTTLLAGHKSKKLMPFFLKNEALIMPINENLESDIRYFLISDYFNRTTHLNKFKSNFSAVGYNDSLYFTSVGQEIELPIMDLSLIKSKDALERKIENIITFY